MDKFDNKHPKYKQLKLYYFATPDAHRDMFVETERVRHMWTSTPLTDIVKGGRVSFYDSKKQRDDDFFTFRSNIRTPNEFPATRGPKKQEDL